MVNRQRKATCVDTDPKIRDNTPRTRLLEYRTWPWRNILGNHLSTLDSIHGQTKTKMKTKKGNTKMMFGWLMRAPRWRKHIRPVGIVIVVEQGCSINPLLARVTQDFYRNTVCHPQFIQKFRRDHENITQQMRSWKSVLTNGLAYNFFLKQWIVHRHRSLQWWCSAPPSTFEMNESNTMHPERHSRLLFSLVLLSFVYSFVLANGMCEYPK